VAVEHKLAAVEPTQCDTTIERLKADHRDLLNVSQRSRREKKSICHVSKERKEEKVSANPHFQYVRLGDVAAR